MSKRSGGQAAEALADAGESHPEATSASLPANGSGAERDGVPTTDADSKVAQLRRNGQALSAALGEVTAVLMRDKRFRHMTLAEIESAVVPALLSNQFMLMRGTVRAKEEGSEEMSDGFAVPLGVAFWASVSDAVSEKLARQKADGAGYRLAPNEWKSGDNLWLLAMVGPPQALPALREKATEAFKGRAMTVFQ